VWLYAVDEQLAWKWLAPEVMREHMFRAKSDVWSFGVFVIELLQYGAEPYAGLYMAILLISFISNEINHIHELPLTIHVGRIL